MCLKAPKFWDDKDSALPAILSPLSCLYLAGHRINQSLKTPYHSRLPVICVGNIVAGGSGKTPTALAVAKLIKDKGLAQNPVFLTRGYGGKLKGPTYVSPEKHSAAEVGDESLLLARAAPTILSADRAAGARLAELGDADLIIMDDGLQNNGLAKTISLLVVDSKTGFGNGKLLPAGPLREPVEEAMDRIDAVISIGSTADFEKPALEAAITPASIDGDKKYIAFAGIGRPQKFYETLRDLGTDICGWHEFGDHYAYKKSDLEKLKTEADEKGAVLITTEKDHVRLPKDFREQVKTLPITLSFKDEDKFVALLKEKIA